MDQKDFSKITAANNDHSQVGNGPTCVFESSCVVCQALHGPHTNTATIYLKAERHLFAFVLQGVYCELVHWEEKSSSTSDKNQQSWNNTPPKKKKTKKNPQRGWFFFFFLA